MKKFKYLNIDSLKIEFYKRFPDSNMILLDFISDRVVEIKDCYGICYYSINHILHEGTSSILNSINKTEYFINQSKEIYGDKYDYSLVSYVNSKTKVELICHKHGKFLISPVKHLCKQGCRKCGYEIVLSKNISNTQEFIKKSRLIHKNKYDYSLLKYECAMSKIKIICEEHGVFEQIASSHLNGSGCQKCKNLKTSIRNIENPTGWKYTNWEKVGLKSKNFEEFKVYIIKCWNNNEEFYKIGKTFTSINKRFEFKNLLPYDFTIIKSFKGAAREISELETKLKMINKENKYLPNIKFNGMYECFNKLENYEEFFIT